MVSVSAPSPPFFVVLDFSFLLVSRSWHSLPDPHFLPVPLVFKRIFVLFYLLFLCLQQADVQIFQSAKLLIPEVSKHLLKWKHFHSSPSPSPKHS